ncbi:tRNA (adenosine(37)-N6)-threonylcarbamoyltransferase complex dimerization subunit type 1 TsaB [Hydrogenophaga taeniospiralis]|uniref:tRNA (adenosine(37)-N6)-threonylcarbamoyltransferase complex dimerization subunit type 1 TsaB n=1 Tax=Hydrogenophaga taeniospiralis TaxID=65656 RepID=UPI000B2B0530|nr:tRNA (adenosine(37)-N6)-threonylcarbamoyltransferase complex dimerization subunit type 1 TsaB [Hydrogenophaga taeniospiralis]
MSLSPESLDPATRSPLRLLALETSTDTLSVAVGPGAPGRPVRPHTGPGGAQASATLLPVVQTLLAQAGWALHELDALVFGRGPGSFTGLRTACAVAQGLAYGARGAGRAGGIPVLPVDTLHALAEEARWQREQAGQALPAVIVALLDARMDEMYVALYACGPQGLAIAPLQPPRLCAPAELGGYLQQSLPPALSLEAGDCLLAGNVFDAYGAQFSDLPGARQRALPTASALLRLAPALLAAGHAVAAQDALPLYVRDKVAQTTAEREQLRLDHLARLAAPTPTDPLGA